MIDKKKKAQIIKKFATHESDTGSSEVQIALLTKRIEKLIGHLKTNASDNHSRRGLLGIVSKRRRLLNYLEKKDIKRYKMIATKLGVVRNVEKEKWDDLNFDPPLAIKAMEMEVIPPGTHVNVYEAYEQVMRVKGLTDILFPLHEPRFASMDTFPA